MSLRPSHAVQAGLYGLGLDWRCRLLRQFRGVFLFPHLGPTKVEILALIAHTW